MADTDRDRILEKVKKCLARAKSDNPNEADIALRMARKLMDQHQLDLQDVRASEAREEVIDAETKKEPPVWKTRLAMVCAQAFGCEVIISGGWFGWSFKVIGVDSAPDLAVYAYEVLLRQLQHARKAFLETQTRCKLATKRRRADEFANGWIDAVYRMVADFSGTDDAHAEILEAYTAKKYPNLKSSPLKRRKTKAKDEDAVWAGRDAGRSARLNHGVATGPKPQALEQLP